MGSDDTLKKIKSGEYVSIHAPAWGATRKFHGSLGQDHSFNPRSRMGSDRILQKIALNMFWFQSTLPHGERRKFQERDKGAVSFNPRSRMGSDLLNQGLTQPEEVSIHAPAWGATSLSIEG